MPAGLMILTEYDRTVWNLDKSVDLIERNKNWRPYRESKPFEVLRIASSKRLKNRVKKGEKRRFTFLDKCCHNEAMLTLLVRNCQENKF